MAKINRNNARYALQAVATIIVALATLEATFLIQYYSSRQAISSEATNQAVAQLEATNLRISVVLDQVEAAVRNNIWPVRKTLATPDSLWHLGVQLVECNPAVYGSAIALMEDYFPEKGRLFSPYAYRNGDRIDTLQLGNESYGYPAKEWFVKPLELNAGYWSEPYFDTGGGEMLMTTYSLPVTDVQGKVAAVLTADVSLDWLTDLVGSPEMYPEAFSALISRTGQLMVCPAPAFVLKKSIQDVAATMPDSTAVRDLSLAMLAGERGSREITYKGEKEYVFFAPIDRAGWSMAIVVPHREIYGDVQRMGLMIILLQILGLLVMSYILYSALKSQRRIREMSDTKNRIDSELRVARDIQKSMIPTAFLTAPEQTDIDMWGVVVPAKEVGGDLYDFYVRNGYLFFCIGDVSGKGVPAALVMSVTRSLFRSVSAHEKSPQRIVTIMNESVADMNENDMFVTCFVGVLDLSNGHLQYCNAGHNPPVRLGPGSASFLEVVPNIPLAVLPDMHFREQETILSFGEGLFLYTDGLTEAENMDHVLFGEDRLLKTALRLSGEKAEVLVESMTAAVNAHARGCDPSDDLTMLAIRFTNPAPSACWERRLCLTNDIVEIPRLHQFMQAVAEQADLDHALATNLNLALEEAVSNVMLYAYPTGTTGQVDIDAAVLEDRIDFTVSDSGVPFDPTASADPDLTADVRDRPVGGLGIYLVKRIMDHVSYAREGGKNILKMTKIRENHGNTHH
jgi:sigma-B regulation protein RsbU (phosphoserine phosphatase)